jgi:hypothetical protein
VIEFKDGVLMVHLPKEQCRPSQWLPRRDG